MGSIFVPFTKPLIETMFLERPNRFILHCRYQGEIITVHLPDPGRLTELLQEGASVYVQHSDDKGRKTEWSAVCVRSGTTLVSLNTTIANTLVEKALKEHRIPLLEEADYVRREYTLEGSRFDFLLHEEKTEHLVEVKSVTLGIDGIGYFPDAVTKRGRKHVEELTEYVLTDQGKATVIFVIGRDDLRLVKPADAIDPQFANALRKASKAGVNLIALSNCITLEGVQLKKEIPFVIEK
ncbi:sugar fermentation stimulation protein [Pontibacillus halophilus JSM 076056 = DSM 19796]|uniref:Sugar fermentation stimulation protein homolog n=1 Tax=Pontibacillus halophilus JSM 076056 = DSM 19796 TaxID=1385510 RepID=A0A0A5GLC3_9BACI|nr:DNA/RNA nuclease SfsA [Pontibacillus halophilus]KGX91960.1 sugar fermentation stimulation protein [Pontibacillus halophilus JSM 076056 = DSM 19796]